LNKTLCIWEQKEHHREQIEPRTKICGTNFMEQEQQIFQNKEINHDILRNKNEKIVSSENKKYIIENIK
jgi:hypothetical protein